MPSARGPAPRSTTRHEAIVLVGPHPLDAVGRRHLRALAPASGLLVRTVQRHGRRPAFDAVTSLWRRAGVRSSEVLVVDGCGEPCRVPEGTIRVAPAEATSILSLLRARRAGGELPAIPDDDVWTIEVDGANPADERMHDSWLVMADGVLGTLGSPLAAYPPARREVLVAGTYVGIGPATDLLRVPDWTRLAGELRPDRPVRRVLDLRTGLVHHEATSTAGEFRAVSFASRATPGVGVLRAQGGGARVTRDGPLALPPLPSDPRTHRRHHDHGATVIRVAAEPGGVSGAARDSVAGSGPRRRLDRIAAYRVGHHDAPPAGAATGLLHRAERRGVDRLLADQRAAWARRWEDMGIRIQGDDDLQRAVNFALFHLDASIAGQREAPLGPRGLSGPSYRGHVFWDSEIFVLPFFAATRAPAARAMLAYRVHRLDAAMQAASAAGLAGAWFPWESAALGRDVTPQWVPGADAQMIRVWTGERELHVVADIAWAVDHYVAWSGDAAFARDGGLRILVETARFWASRLEQDADGTAHLRGVMGPDEYHELVSDNAFTNVMARWNLNVAADAVEGARGQPGAHPGPRTPHRAGAVRPAVGLPDPDEVAGWRSLATRIVDGYDPGTRIYEQFAGFHALEPVRIADMSRRPVAGDVLLGRERVARAQVVKQTDVLLLHHLVPHEVAPGSLDANLDYYEPRTAHGSSLSPGTHATLLARAGRWGPALEALAMTAFMDLDDRNGTAAEGLHIPTMGSLWQALAMGIGGIRPAGDALALDPRLPPSWTEVAIPVRFRGTQVRVTIGPGRLTVRSGRTVTLDVRGAGRLPVGRRGVTLTQRDDGWFPADG